MSTAQRMLLRGVSALVGLLLIAAALLGTGQIIASTSGAGNFLLPASRWYDNLRSGLWSSPGVIYAAAILIVVGVLLILVSLMSRPKLFTLAQPADGIDVLIAPRAVATMLRRQAEAVRGVSSASVEVTADIAHVNAVAPMANFDRVEADLERALTHALKQIPWARPPRIDLEVVTGDATTPTRTTSSTEATGGLQ